MTRTRDAIELDLAFAVNGALTEAEHAEMAAWLAQDPDLLAERDALAAIRTRMQAEQIDSPGAFGLARLMRDVERTRAAPNRTWIWQIAAAVSMIALLGQTLFWRPAAQPHLSVAGFEMASADRAADRAAGLIVSFAPTATEGQIRTLLVDLGVEIVAGPSALGFYTLDVLEGGDHTAAVEGLRMAAGLVESVEDAAN